jgi:hypothetical protein
MAPHLIALIDSVTIRIPLAFSLNSHYTPIHRLQTRRPVASRLPTPLASFMFLHWSPLRLSPRIEAPENYLSPYGSLLIRPNTYWPNPTGPIWVDSWSGHFDSPSWLPSQSPHMKPSEPPSRTLPPAQPPHPLEDRGGRGWAGSRWVRDPGAPAHPIFPRAQASAHPLAPDRRKPRTLVDRLPTLAPRTPPATSLGM